MDWEAKIQSEQTEAASRAASRRENAENSIRLAIVALTNVPETEIEIGQADIDPDSSAFSIEATVQGHLFRYVKDVRTGYGSQAVLLLVQTCRQCGREILTDVRFMWQLGAALEDAIHRDGICPVDEPLVAPVRARRPMTDGEERLLDGLVAVMAERGIATVE